MAAGDGASAGRPWRRSVAIDVAALTVIAIATMAIRSPFLRHGMTFSDASWFFHFGRRALHGDVPYRDYVFQVGPLPIYVDALFQKLFGGTYLASLYAALCIHVLRVFVLWLLVRRLVGWKAAALMAVFGVCDSFFAWSHHWSWAYAQLFISISGLCYLAAAAATRESRALGYLALAGFSAGASVFARQATAITAGAVLFVATLVLLARAIYVTRQRLIALWTGFAAAFVVLFGALACAGAAGAALRQIFLDAPEKKGVDGVSAVLDAISGGSLTIGGWTWWRGFLVFLALPTLFTAGVLAMTARADRRISTRTIALWLFPVGLVIGLATRHAQLIYFGDLPRCFLTMIAAFALAAPRRLAGWFGVEPMAAIMLGVLPMASDMALEMSYPGRGWGDWLALLLGAVLVALASSRLTARTKTALCAGFALAGAIHFVGFWRSDLHPFAKDDGTDGTLAQTAFPARSPLLAGTLLSQPRARMLEWLGQYVRPGDSCFVYGIIPILYDVLECKNATKIDVTIPDFITARDANQALEILRADPPEFVIAQEESFMNPALSLDLEGKIEWYSLMNSQAGKVIYLGLHHLMVDQYDDLGLLADLLGPTLVDQVRFAWDRPASTRLYRRRHEGSTR